MCDKKIPREGEDAEGLDSLSRLGPERSSVDPRPSYERLFEALTSGSVSR